MWLVSIKLQANLIGLMVRLNKTPSEALTLLQQVYGKVAMSHSCVFKWHKQFKEGCEDLENGAKSKRLSTCRTDANVECMRQMVCSDHQLTIQVIADELDIN